jgi:hypothetical protein
MNIQLLPVPPTGALPFPADLLREAIPTGAIPFIASEFFVTPDHVRRWRRHLPTRSERERQGPLGTGAASPLDRCCELVRRIASYDMKAAGRVSLYPSFYYQALVETSSEGFSTERACAEANMQLLKEAEDAIKFMTLEGCCFETLREQTELRDIAQQMIARTFATMLRRAA